MPHRVWLLRGPLKHTRLSGLLGLYGNIILLRVSRVSIYQEQSIVTWRRQSGHRRLRCRKLWANHPGWFHRIGEEKWLFFHGVVVSDLSSGSARMELKFGCYCHVPLKFFSPTTRPATNTRLLPTRYHPVASRLLFYMQGNFLTH